MSCGFQFDARNKICDCDSRLRIDEKVQCHIRDGLKYITRSPALWIAAGTKGEGVRFNTKCPKSRCVLVLFVKLLDLTVADGFINGLVFYCNIVWINKDILLPSNRAGTGFLRVFLAWFNLDVGITT